MSQDEGPTFSAVSSSARQLFILLRCINFSPKTQVQITEEGLRFSVEESSVMEGTAYLESSLFTTYKYNAPTPSSPRSNASQEAEGTSPIFAISFPSLLETLQIFGLTAENRPNPFGRDTNHAFSNQVLGVSGLCRLGYEAPGSPLTIVLEEQGIRTTCELTTYEPSVSADIPFLRDQVSLKVVMRASYLYDAISEVSAHNPPVITLSARKRIFTVAATSDLGSAVVDFHRDAKSTYKTPSGMEDQADSGRPNPQSSGLLETFHLANGTEGSFSQSYKFSHIAATKRALQAATKVSIRADVQGVLNMQFMIENLEGGGASFVDFRFVPLIGDEDDHGDDRPSTSEEEDEIAGAAEEDDFS